MGIIYILTYLFVAIKTGYSVRNKYAFSIYNSLAIKVLNLLYLDGYIEGYKMDLTSKKIIIKLKYYKNLPFITNIDVLSKPSYKNYVKYKDLSIFKKKYDYFCILTSQGLISSSSDLYKANLKIGGKLLFGFKIITM